VRRVLLRLEAIAHELAICRADYRQASDHVAGILDFVAVGVIVLALGRLQLDFLQCPQLDMRGNVIRAARSSLDQNVRSAERTVISSPRPNRPEIRLKKPGDLTVSIVSPGRIV
jgi:hypothetical protein